MYNPGRCRAPSGRFHRSPSERLLLIYVVAVRPRPLIDDRGTAGVEVKCAQIGERIPRERLQARAQLEAASYPRRQIVIEVVRPVAAVDPSHRTMRRTVDYEGRGRIARIAQRDHRFGKSRRHLPDLLHRSARREAHDGRRSSAGSGRKGEEQNGDADARDPKCERNQPTSIRSQAMNRSSSRIATAYS